MPKLIHSTRNKDQRVPDVEIADLPASVEAPAVPGRSGKAHLTPVGNPNVTGVGHGASLQGNNNVCIVEPRIEGGALRFKLAWIGCILL